MFCYQPNVGMRLLTGGIWFTLDFYSGKVCFVSLVGASFIVRDLNFREADWVFFMASLMG